MEYANTKFLVWQSYFRVKTFERKRKQNFGNVQNMNNRKFLSTTLYLGTKCHFENISLNVDRNKGGKWVIHGHKRRKKNQLLSLKHTWDRYSYWKPSDKSEVSLIFLFNCRVMVNVIPAIVTDSWYMQLLYLKKKRTIMLQLLKMQNAD